MNIASGELWNFFEPTLMALAQIYQVRGDVDALGLLVQLVDPSFVLSALMLADMLGVIRPLTLWLQTSPATISCNTCC